MTDLQTEPQNVPDADSGADAAADADVPNTRVVFLEKMLSQVGKKFEMGARAETDDPSPHAFDASELVEWASHQAGVPVPDGSWIQYQHIDEHGSTLDVEDALATEGALLFWFSEDPLGRETRPDVAHVAVSLGDGRVIEATNGKHDIVRIAEHGGRFTHAGEVPELVGVSLSSEEAIEMWQRADFIAEDLDRDGILDSAEKALGYDPGMIDTDRDGIRDGTEAQIGWYDEVADRRDLDADGDGLLDAAEIRLGTDPYKVDTDGDGIDDHLEIMTGLDPHRFDSSIFARSDEGLAKGSHEDNAMAFGTMTLQEHINYLRLETDPDDPRVSVEFKENFALFGREPDPSDEAAYDEWHKNYRMTQSELDGYKGEFDEDGFEIETPPVDAVEDQTGQVVDPTLEPESDADQEPGDEPIDDASPEPVTEPIDEAIGEPLIESVVEPDSEPVVEPVVDPVIEPVVEPAANFSALDDDLTVMETELMQSFDDLDL